MPRASKTPWLGKEPNQNVWYIYWYQSAGRVRRRSTRTHDRVEAEKALGQFIIEYADEETPGPIEPPEKYLIATALRWYAQERGPEIASSEAAGIAIEYFVSFFGARATVSSITPQVLKRYAKERKRKVRFRKTPKGKEKIINEKPISNGTIRRELMVLSAALNHAVKNGRLTSAPKIIMPPQPPHKTRYLERAEIERLLAECKEPHLKLFTLLALNTGSRKGALLELKWPQVDLVNRLIYLNPEEREQSNKRRSIVPINDQLYEALIQTQADIKKRAEDREREGKPHQPSCNYVVAYHNAPLIDIKIGFRNACKRAGIKGVTPHTLRHTAGTLMALAGVDLFLIAKVLGHSAQKTTELYAHCQPCYLRSAVDALGQATAGI
ncbi:MAG: site-specific integrase [Alphaproteobacteria bacterium]|nr:site-specific integrase [Alphaproteobacteria bacterium]